MAALKIVSTLIASVLNGVFWFQQMLFVLVSTVCSRGFYWPNWWCLNLSADIAFLLFSWPLSCERGDEVACEMTPLLGERGLPLPWSQTSFPGFGSCKMRAKGQSTGALASQRGEWPTCNEQSGRRYQSKIWSGTANVTASGQSRATQFHHVMQPLSPKKHATRLSLCVCVGLVWLECIFLFKGKHIHGISGTATFGKCFYLSF